MSRRGGHGYHVLHAASAIQLVARVKSGSRNKQQRDRHKTAGTGVLIAAWLPMRRAGSGQAAHHGTFGKGATKSRGEGRGGQMRICPRGPWERWRGVKHGAFSASAILDK